MTDSYFEKILRSSHTFLNRWKDADGELWELTRSHKSLQILLQHPLKKGNLVIACIDPRCIEGPVRWKNTDIEISLRQLTGPTDIGFSVEDRRSGLSVVCGALELKENVKID